MLKNNVYNTDREFDYATVQSIVLKSLEKIAKEEALKTRPNVLDDVIFDHGNVDDLHNRPIKKISDVLLEQR
jgi:hypothetical protein